ncbi:polyprenyl synthetase family protein [Selenomonas sp. TAMA-11512]|uniref:polyprenyl synthetase family protein n=1 Tax=Selenomonas sp. TAMA-11512 TaxID=3095337 RepID=UPI0030CF8E8E
MDSTKERIGLIERALQEALSLRPAYEKKLHQAMEYSLMAGGKRIRPLLLMAAADAVGGHGENFITAACSLEMIHSYSLIHDDLPAMDDDDYRRGKPTNHKVFGEGMAILAGDGLETLAFEVLLRQKAAPETLLAVVRELADAAGPYGMVGGQAIDLDAEDTSIDIKTLQKMHAGKTGALFRAAIRMGAILAGAKEAELAALTEYAEKFGMAFQITDDILDVTGDEALLGKPVGSDEKQHKSTYVSLLSLHEAGELAKKAVDEAIAALEPFGERAAFLRQTVQYLLDRKA